MARTWNLRVSNGATGLWMKQLLRSLPVVRVKRIRQLFFLLISICFLIILYSAGMLSNLDTWEHGLGNNQIFKIMASDPFRTIKTGNPLFTLAQKGHLNFFHLPKRQVGRQFMEVTSANRNTSYRLAPDFSFHIEYGTNYLVLYEDYGPGCMFRNFFFPKLPTDSGLLQKVEIWHLQDSFLHYIIDDKEYKFTVEEVMMGQSWPFLYPINTQHSKVVSGAGIYYPVCYQTFAKVTYILNEQVPPDVFDKTVQCTLNDLLCPMKVYSGISRHKFAPGTVVKPFSQQEKTTGTHVAKLLNSPGYYGPGKNQGCRLSCYTLCAGCRHVIYEFDGAAVIYAMTFRVYEARSSKLVSDWTNVLITMRWDEKDEPQVNKVTLGSLFGATKSLNEVRGAAAGKQHIFCDFNMDTIYKSTETTGYVYFPMPFWKHGVVEIQGGVGLKEDVVICYQILSMGNKYNPRTTGYFYASQLHYGPSVDGWRNVLHLNDHWGHIVGLSMEIENLMAKRNEAPLRRWALLQADPVLFVDDMVAATVLGTGLEDYFSYAHGFSNAGNTSYSFVGAPYGSGSTEPFTWHCYRQHVLDPIPFSKSIHFVMEGLKDGEFDPVKEIDYTDFLWKKDAGVQLSTYLVLYYAKPSPGLSHSDTFQLGNFQSEKAHEFAILSPREGGVSQCVSSSTFGLLHKRYLGSTVKDTVVNRYGRAFSKLCSFTFTMRLSPTARGAVLRREFHSIPKKWNEKSRVYVNGVDHGVWFIPFGSLSDEWSLREDDFIISISATEGRTDIKIRIDTETDWRDLSYMLYSVEK